jgi:hypothetical protein
MLFLGPPPLTTPQPQAFDWANFKATRLHPQSDPALRMALDRLFQDCPSFRALLAAFAGDQPSVRLLLETTEEKDYGGFVLHRTAGDYLIRVKVQARLVDLGYDSFEPWLGSLLFVLADLCRGRDVTQLSNGNWLLDPSAEATFWKNQRWLRLELNRATTKPRLKLTLHLMNQYGVFVLRKGGFLP